jgi:hypothetical protein
VHDSPAMSSIARQRLTESTRRRRPCRLRRRPPPALA